MAKTRTGKEGKHAGNNKLDIKGINNDNERKIMTAREPKLLTNTVKNTTASKEGEGISPILTL